MTVLEKIKKAPTKPGCYLYKNSNGEIIYIGKAKNIKKRVASYFKNGTMDGKTKKLASEISDVEFIITDNEIEALLLEAQLIKKNKPLYNIDLKNSVRYAYLKFTDERFPRLITTREVKKGDKVFGPYTSGYERRSLVHLASEIFGLRSGKLLTRKSRQLGPDEIYIEPGIGRITSAEYAENVKKAEMLLRGKNNELIKTLTDEMKKFSSEHKYELAKLRRDQIIALENLSERQKVQLTKKYNQDVINFVDVDDTFIVQFFNINKGVISGRKTYELPKKISMPAAQRLSEFIVQYYYTEDIPEEVIVPVLLEDKDVLEQYLSKLAERKIKITLPTRGDKLKLLELAAKNLEITVKLGDSAGADLQEKLKLSRLPQVIECFDISNLGQNHVVASMVYFRNGEPDKNNYRRFKIKTFVGQSDFDAMKEVVFRRYYRIKKEGSQYPDLVMVDGGKPQLRAALEAFNILGIDLPVIALAKQQEEIFVPGRKLSIYLPRNSEALRLVQKIRNEAHRFAITYHRLLRNKKDYIK